MMRRLFMMYIALEICDIGLLSIATEGKIDCKMGMFVRME
jgi:hypothetical protein